MVSTLWHSRAAFTLTRFFTEDILSEKLAADDHLGLEHPNKNRNNIFKYESLNIR